MAIPRDDMMSGLMYAGYATQALGTVGAGTASMRQENYAADIHLQLAKLKEMQAAIIGAEEQGRTRAAFAKSGVSGVTVDLVLEQNAKRAALAERFAGYEEKVSAWEAKNRARAAKYAMIQGISNVIIGAAGAAYSLYPRGGGAPLGGVATGGPSMVRSGSGPTQIPYGIPSGPGSYGPGGVWTSSLGSS